ncbi:unnamed protein product [Calypogeia fissa]
MTKVAFMRAASHCVAVSYATSHASAVSTFCAAAAKKPEWAGLHLTYLILKWSPAHPSGLLSPVLRSVTNGSGSRR